MCDEVDFVNSLVCVCRVALASQRVGYLFAHLTVGGDGCNTSLWPDALSDWTLPFTILSLGY